MLYRGSNQIRLTLLAAFPTGFLTGLFATFLSTLAGRRVTFFLSAARTALLSASRFLVYRGPRAGFRFLLGHSAIFVAFFDVFSLPLLFVGILSFVSSWHSPYPPCFLIQQMALRKSSARASSHVFSKTANTRTNCEATER